jgi:nucleoside-diphosphate-sugar epimerase
MKILIVGGTGMVGGHAALRLHDKGHEVTLASRKPAPVTTPLCEMEFVKLNYIEDDIPASALARFEAVIFCAGQDARHMPVGAAEESYMWRTNAVALPAFFAKLREAGVSTAIYIGTFYPQAAPYLAPNNHYIRSRKLADEAICALATDKFRVFSINPPWLPGAVEGLSTILWDPYLRYAAGMTDLPIFAPPGGVAYMSCDSVTDAIEGGLERGQAGASYLVNDENLTFETFLGALFEAFGNPAPKVENREHPIIIDLAIAWGRGNSLFYEADPQEAALLGYRRGDIVRTIKEEMVPEFRRRTGLR